MTPSANDPELAEGHPERVEGSPYRHFFNKFDYFKSIRNNNGNTIVKQGY